MRGRQDEPWCGGPVVAQPVVQTLFGVGAHNAIALIFHNPFHAGQQICVEVRVRKHAPHMLFILDLPRLRYDHEVELTGGLLILYCEAAADRRDALVGADKEETPFRRNDRYHMQDLWHEMRHRAPLNQQRNLCRVVRRERVAFGVEFDLYRWDLLARARDLLLERLLVTREEASDCPSAAKELEWSELEEGEGQDLHCY